MSHAPAPFRAAGRTLLLLSASAAAATLAAPAQAAETVGPPALNAPAVKAPELSNRTPFRAGPLLVSGTDALRAGEYVHQDYLFDDRGADTRPVGNAADPGKEDPTSTGDVAASAGGDVRYPTDARFAGNAADIAEVRVLPTRDAVLYRVTFHAPSPAGVAVVGIGIDTDRSGGAPVPWPNGAGISSPGLDAFVTAWGTGGEVRIGDRVVPLAKSAVLHDVRRHQMTITVPRSLLDPDARTWRLVAGAGLWDDVAKGWRAPQVGLEPTTEQAASGSPTTGAPAVFNLAFRFDEPVLKTPTPPYTTFPGVGNWFEDGQARALADRTSGSAFADVDFGALARRETRALHAPGRVQARIFASALPVHEGVTKSYPEYGGALQPYVVTIPPSAGSKPRGLLLALHSFGGNLNQFQVFSPLYDDQLGQDAYVVTPLSRSLAGGYAGVSEADTFEVMADVRRRFPVDDDRIAATGYSMGGFGAYRLAERWPDVFSRVFSVVGSSDTALLGNLRSIPTLAWAQATDELVGYQGPRGVQDRATQLGIDHELWTFSPGEHFTLAIYDEWRDALEHLGDLRRTTRSPARITHTIKPANDKPELGLVADRAYWVSGLRSRRAPTVAASVDARSLARGVGDPVMAPVLGAGPTPTPNAKDGLRLDRTTTRPAENALELTLDGISALRVDAAAAGLDRTLPVRLAVKSDGPATLVVTGLRGGPRTVTVPAGEGTRTLRR